MSLGVGQSFGTPFFFLAELSSERRYDGAPPTLALGGPGGLFAPLHEQGGGEDCVFLCPSSHRAA